MNDSEQKQQEAASFRCLMAVLEVTWAFDQPDPPAPDVLVPSQRLGVEITGLFNDDEVARREGEEGATLDRARREYEAAGHPPVDVSVIWGRHDPRGSDRARRMQAIVDCVLAHLPPEPNGVAAYDLRAQDAVPFYNLRLRRIPQGRPLTWRASFGGFPPHCDPALIQERITKKTEHVAEYRTHCDQLWLLIVAQHMGAATAWSNVEPAARESFTSSFDRAYLLIQPAQLYRLRTQLAGCYERRLR